MSEPYVRDAVRSDLPAIVAIYNDAVTNTVATFDLEPTTVEQRQSWFAQFTPGEPLLVCADGSTLLGFAYYLPYRPKPAYAASKEVTVYVERSVRAQGVGARLYQVLLERARAAGVHALVAVLSGDNIPSVALHQKFGFERVGHLREMGFKFGAWVDITIFQRVL